MDTGICFALACKVIDGGAGCRTILFKKLRIQVVGFMDHNIVDVKKSLNLCVAHEMLELEGKRHRCDRREGEE